MGVSLLVFSSKIKVKVGLLRPCIMMVHLWLCYTCKIKITGKRNVAFCSKFKRFMNTLSWNLSFHGHWGKADVIISAFNFNTYWIWPTSLSYSRHCSRLSERQHNLGSYILSANKTYGILINSNQGLIGKATQSMCV